MLDWVDRNIGDEKIQEGLAAIELEIFEQRAWSEKQKEEIHKRVELHKTARKEVDKLGRTHFRSIKNGQFVKAH